jgi:hypothetical protein
MHKALGSIHSTGNKRTKRGRGDDIFQYRSLKQCIGRIITVQINLTFKKGHAPG